MTQTAGTEPPVTQPVVLVSGPVSTVLAACPKWPRVLSSDAPSLFIPVVRIKGAAVDEEWVLQEVEMEVLPPHFTTKTQIRWQLARGDRLASIGRSQ